MIYRLIITRVDVCLIREAVQKLFFRNIFFIRGGGVSIPKLYMEFWWPLFLAKKFTFLFLNLVKTHMFIPKSKHFNSFEKNGGY